MNSLFGACWLGSTHTDGSTTAAWPQNSSYVADGKYISLVLYRVAVNNTHERQNTVSINVCRLLTPVSSEKTRYPAVCVNSHRTKTQHCSCEKATFQLHVLNCSCTATTMLLYQTLFSIEIESLQLFWRPSRLQVAVHIGVQPTATS